MYYGVDYLCLATYIVNYISKKVKKFNLQCSSMCEKHFEFIPKCLKKSFRVRKLFFCYFSISLTSLLRKEQAG